MKLDNRLWILVTVVVCGALLAGGWFLGVQPQLAAVGAADEQRDTVTSQNADLAAEITRLREAKKDESSSISKLADLKKSVPPGIEGSSFIAEVNGLVSSSSVSLQSLTLGQAVPYVAPAGTSQPADGTSAGQGSATPSPTPSASASSGTAAAPAVVTGPLTVAPLTDPLITSANFISVPVDIVVKGSNDQVGRFLSGLQRGDRLVLVNKVDRKVDEETGEATLTLHGSIYVLRDPSTVAQTSTTTGAAANG